MEFLTGSRFNVARSLVVALIASLLVLVTPPGMDSKADYVDVQVGAITYNDRVCNLGDPNNHSTSATAFEISNSEQLWEITDCVSNSATIYFELGDDINVAGSTAPTNSPIGYSTSSIAYSFSGVLNGNNKIISGISMSGPVDYGAGLFAYMHNATVSNLTITGNFQSNSTTAFEKDGTGALGVRSSGTLVLNSISNQAKVSGANFVGGLVGYAANSILASSVRNFGEVSGTTQIGGIAGRVIGTVDLSDSSNEATVSGVSQHVGGLIGLAQDVTTLTSTSNKGAISGSNRVAGLVGQVSNQFVVHSAFNSAPIWGSGDNVGGLAGYVSGVTTINLSRNIAPIFSGAGDAGGFLGEVANDVNIHDSFNSASVTGSGDVGGLVGYLASDLTVNNSYNIGNVYNYQGDTGGLAGYVDSDAYITFASNSGSVTGDGSNVGGLLGHVYQETQINSSSNTGTVSGAANHVGGLVGLVDDYHLTINSSFNSAMVLGAGTGTGGLAGAIAANNRVATFNSSQNYGAVESSGSEVGGLIGISTGRVTINLSLNSGSVTSQGDRAGGFVGFANSRANVSMSYNSGSISGQGTAKKVGGFIGEANDLFFVDKSFNSGTISSSGDGAAGFVAVLNNGGSITSSYNVGEVTGAEDGVAGFIGYLLNGDLSISSSYNAGTLSGNALDGLVADTNGNIVATSSVYTLVASQLATANTDAEMKLAITFVGFDFQNTWGFLICGPNSGYPLLRVFGLVTSATHECAGSSAAQGSGSSGASAASAPSYTGPMVTTQTTAPVPGKPLVIAGKKLSQVTQVTIGGVSLTVSAVTDESITIEVPQGLQPGSYDLVLFSGQGKLTVMNFITIAAVQASPSSLGELLGYRWTERFTGNSRTMNTAQERSITAALALFDADTVICWAYTTALIPNDWALAHATARAKSACDFVAETNPGLRTAVRVKYGVSKNAAMRVSLQFWELKNTN